MKLYLFEYYEDKQVRRFPPVRAANAWDAFDIFRSHLPDVVIAEAWVVPLGPQHNYVDSATGLAG